MAYSPLASGKVVPRRNAAPATPAADLLSALDAVAAQLGATRSQIATAWVLAQPQVTSVVSGGSRPEHVEDSFAGSNLVLPIDALEVLNSASDIFAERVRESGKKLANVKKCSRYRDRAKESGEQEVWEENCSWQMEQLRQAP
jgi:aryl-alcohol dehydrogenase-like predicted oxidoreductase